jgi:hypothetical protein
MWEGGQGKNSSGEGGYRCKGPQRVKVGEGEVDGLRGRKG